MKPSEFYADFQSTTVGITGLTFTEKWTQPALSIYNSQTPNSFSTEAYYLGWIRYDNLPVIMGHHSVTVDAENDSLVFEDNTVVDNYPCGYLRQNNYYYSQIFVEDGVVIPGVGNYTPFMHNDLHPEYSALNAAALQFKYYRKVDGEIVPRSSIVSDVPSEIIWFGYGSVRTMQELIDFLNGSSTLTCTINNLTYDLDASQLTAGYGEFVSNEDNTNSILIFLSSIMLNSPRYSRANSSGDFPSAFFATVKYEDSSQVEHSYDVVLANDNQSALGLGIYYWNNSNFVVDSNIKYSGKVSGEFKLSDLTSMSATTGYAISGNVFCYCKYGSGGSNPRTQFSILATPEDMLRTISLYYRVDFSGTNPPTATYVKDVTYATNVTSDDEFLAELKTGNISDDTFRNGLRYWQYSSIASNDFDEDDVPPYEPPAPPAEGEESGDLIDNQYRYFGASKFITQYALTRSQLELFGEKLWTSWADTLGDPTEMWKNFKMFIGGGGDTGSIDISTAMDFIISLRVFPYDLTDSLMQDVNGIRLGRGEYPIDVGVVKKMISLIQYVDFGTITVPRPFGDYRDYENMNVSLVLPYCGTTMLNPGDVIGRNLTCTYAVDLQAGTCEAFVYVTNTGDTGQCRYNVAQMSGQIGALLPVSATNSGQIMSQRISDAASVAGLVVGEHTGRLASMANAVIGQSQSESGNVPGGMAGVGATMHPLMNPKTYGAISEAANALSRPALECPSLGGGSGLSAFHQPAAPYIQLRYGMYTKPNNYNHAVGVPSTSNGVLSSYSGYVVCANVDVSSLTCHTDEKAAIKAALESGVYV